MCGIAGVIRYNNISNNDALVVEQMLKDIKHRGPDSENTYTNYRDLYIGGVRLAIVDRAKSNQPLKNEDGSVVMFYNGEIYNYQHLRRALIGRGHHFRTDGDGEVIIHLYEECPKTFAEKLDGMFTFVIWDENHRRLILGRDRVGIKPLYYWENQNELCFASESQALFWNKSIPLSLDYEGVQQYLGYRFTFAPNTIYSNIKKLEPATILKYEKDKIEIYKYWDCLNVVNMKCSNQEVFNTIFTDAVNSTFDENVSIGMLLSGGLDSSSIAASLRYNKPINMFTVGYDISGVEDERVYAKIVAEHLMHNYHETIVDSNKVMDHMKKVICALGEPIYSTASLSTYLACSLASQHERVVMSGDGSDELLLGYEHFRIINNVIKDKGNWREVYRQQIGLLSNEWQDRLYSDELIKYRDSDIFNKIPQDRSPFEQVFLFELLYRLPEYHLLRVDRLSMNHSLEVRVPFLRNKLVEWALNSNKEALLYCEQEKELLRDVVKQTLPPVINRRAKQKFSSPYISWLTGPLNKIVFELLLTSGYHTSLGIRKKGLEELKSAFERDPLENARFVWGVFILFSWYETVWSGNLVKR